MNNTTPNPQADTRQQVAVIPTATQGPDAKPVLVESLPVEMRYSDAFLRWQYFVKPEGGGYKSPVNRHSRKKGYDNTDIWMSYDDAVAAVKRSSAMIGISLGTVGLQLTCDGRIGYLWCLDFDGFAELNGTGVDRQAHSMVNRIDSYCEISPSTTGFKAFFVSDKLPQTKDKIRFSDSEFAEKFPEVRKYKHREIEVLSKGLFLTMTGKLFNQDSGKLRFIPEAELKELLDWLHDQAVGSGGKGRPTDVSKLSSSSAQGVGVRNGVVNYSRLMPGSLETVLRYADCVDEGAWCDVSNALARAYGEEGRDYFEAYSRGDYAGVPYADFDQDTVTKRFDRSLRELEKHPDGVGVNRLIELASVHGDWPDSNLEYEDTLVSGLDIARGAKLTPVDSNHVVFGGDAHGVVSEWAMGDVLGRATCVADIGNGELFARQNRGKLLYIDDTGDWLRFTSDVGWISAEPKAAEAGAKAVAKGLTQEAAEAFKVDPTSSRAKQMLSEATRSSKAPNVRAMIDMSKSESGMTALLNDFDADHWLLGVKNGVLDLRTGGLLSISPDMRVSKRCNVVFDTAAGCPNFKKYLQEVVPDSECRLFLQRWCGYMLTGEVNEQKMLFLYGSGRNGKSVFVELLAGLLGDYARKVQTEMLMRQHRSPQGASPDIVGLHGRRLIYCNETTEGRHLDDARIKDLTGGDTLVGRVPYAKAEMQFQPTHKLIIAGNHQPVITDNSFGLWRRLILFPFSETIAEGSVDKNLLETLKGEISGVLNWALVGLLEWKTNGLMVPTALQKATSAYRRDQDLLEDWLDEHCDIGSNHSAKKADLYTAYKNWCKGNGCRELSQKRFSRQLTDKMYTTASDNRTVVGLQLNSVGKAMAMVCRL